MPPKNKASGEQHLKKATRRSNRLQPEPKAPEPLPEPLKIRIIRAVVDTAPSHEEASNRSTPAPSAHQEKRQRNDGREEYVDAGDEHEKLKEIPEDYRLPFQP
ncbi:hypothetical protein CC1G_09752 [Coprinopsis cinerea okayama7|uniref:Uncharacterized protein n=1 Tax=Coprinopsis cinerea (strain Okayama-7 / 130 / ATCC MYA-4618 / FGSC 9003) TaxID=240176 RepID=A8PE08_COPC7|nr:hypothetical protein CC1G_09752 [Coprinopsis cinerea okayama7\|eukprot:XP_001840701.1 hypothetical protein CC1G_09752 [Coprinopsis cinerea okayama7\